MGTLRNVYRILAGKYKSSRSFGRRTWDDNIKMDHKDIGFVAVD
jgi:hypothetical protein